MITKRRNIIETLTLTAIVNKMVEEADTSLPDGYSCDNSPDDVGPHKKYFTFWPSKERKIGYRLSIKTEDGFLYINCWYYDTDNEVYDIKLKSMFDCAKAGFGSIMSDTIWHYKIPLADPESVEKATEALKCLVNSAWKAWNE